MFLEMLAQTCSVVAAARAAGMSRRAAYRLRMRPDAEDFRRGWDFALTEGVRQIELVALDRVLNGEEEVVEREGMTVAVRRRPCDSRLLIHMLKREDGRGESLRQVTRELAELRGVLDGLVDRLGGEAPLVLPPENSGIRGNL